MMRKLILLLCLFVITTAASISTYRVYENTDSTITIKTYPDSMRDPGETDVEMMDRIDIEEGESKPVLGDVQRVDLPTDRSERHKWRFRSVGVNQEVFIDPSAPDTPEVIASKNLIALKASAKGKLIAGQPLTPDEADALIG